MCNPNLQRIMERSDRDPSVIAALVPGVYVISGYDADLDRPATAPQEARLRSYLQDLLAHGSFPGLIAYPALRSKFYDDEIDPVCYRDLVERYGVSNTSVRRFILEATIDSSRAYPPITRNAWPDAATPRVSTPPAARSPDSAGGADRNRSPPAHHPQQDRGAGGGGDNLDHIKLLSNVISNSNASFLVLHNLIIIVPDHALLSQEVRRWRRRLSEGSWSAQSLRCSNLDPSIG